MKKYIGIALVLLLLVAGVSVWWGYSHLTSLVEARLKSIIGSDVKVGKVTARWNRLELNQVRIPRKVGGNFADRFSFERIVIRPALLSLFSGRLDIKEILLVKPYLLLEIKPDGSFARILPDRATGASDSSTAALPLRVASVSISNGTIDVLDWQIARKGRIGLSNPRQGYHLITLQNVSFSAGAITLPLSEQLVPVRLELSSKGGGHLQIAGDIAPKGLNSKLKIDLSGLNILQYRPYFSKKGDLTVSSGVLSGTSNLSIKDHILNAPGTLYLKDLAFDHSSTKGVLLGIPAWSLVSIMSDNKDLISVSFRVAGNLNNPRFSVQQTLLEQVASALASKIGIPTISGVGKGILEIGEKGLKGIFGITEKK